MTTYRWGNGELSMFQQPDQVRQEGKGLGFRSRQCDSSSLNCFQESGTFIRQLAYCAFPSEKLCFTSPQSYLLLGRQMTHKYNLRMRKWETFQCVHPHTSYLLLLEIVRELKGALGSSYLGLYMVDIYLVSTVLFSRKMNMPLHTL